MFNGLVILTNDFSCGDRIYFIESINSLLTCVFDGLRREGIDSKHPNSTGIDFDEKGSI